MRRTQAVRRKKTTRGTTATGRTKAADQTNATKQAKATARIKKERPVIGWREWVALPDLKVPSIKAKVDTGAATSSLHAWGIEEFRQRGRDMVRFEIHPEQRGQEHRAIVEAPLSDKRHVRPSTGKRQVRHVIVTTLELLGESWEIEITLVDRDAMGFRMLLGRQALRGRLAVDPGRSFINGKRIRGSRVIQRRK